MLGMARNKSFHHILVIKKEEKDDYLKMTRNYQVQTTYTTIYANPCFRASSLVI